MCVSVKAPLNISQTIDLLYNESRQSTGSLNYANTVRLGLYKVGSYYVANCDYFQAIISIRVLLE